MKYIYFLTIAISLTLGCKTVNKTPESFKLSKDTINFGVMNYNDTLNTVVKLYNETESSLKILNIESSCGCTTLQIKDSTVGMFDSTQFQIRYIPSDSFDSGKILKRLTVRTDAKVPFKNILIVGQIKK